MKNQIAQKNKMLKMDKNQLLTVKYQMLRKNTQVPTFSLRKILPRFN